jgi:spore germination protein GerM
MSRASRGGPKSRPEPLGGPSAAEAAAGLVTSIPSGTWLLGLRIDRGVAYVDLSGSFAFGGGSRSMLTRIAQVVHTLTWFPTVGSVRFLIDGREVDAIGGQGVIVDHPPTRADVEGQAPAILIERPTEGQTVSAPWR